MSKTNAESIANTIRRASEIPDDTGMGANVGIPSLFTQFPIPNGEKIIDNTPSPNKGIQGVPHYNFLAHFKRFVIGQIEIGRDENGFPLYENKDDTENYEQLMNDILSGESILRWEERTTLRDGTIIISASYLTPKSKKK
ncbi:MAG: hypothetical protein PVI90_00915 [Desulfobacteraceae bacterium]|jgi:hypothetical protein